jgi:serine/threonine protein kinase/dipeptidyl aminopeptidase/acylaminoacyl peptidase
VALAPGTRIGPYEVTARLGAGGMGEVYRARDAGLDRDVALKVLPPAFALLPDRVARFRREAQVLAALNHPNIAAVYGFEEHPVPALAMEFVDGATLAEIIATGRMTLEAEGSGSRPGDTDARPTRGGGSPRGLNLEDALPLARQIVAAIDAAHAQGIVHRDLKPANVKVRPDGTVKVLDFGLAKALRFDAAPASGAKSVQDLAASPTMTSPAMTEAGMILGTAAYMAPEQARGRPVDHRADIWAFGCLLFEMLAGRRAFAGDDVSETVANILKSEPDWSALPPATPSALRRLLRRCLARDLAQRLPDIGVARLDIDDALSPDAETVPALAASTSAAPRRPRWPFVALGLAVTGLVGVLPSAIVHLRERPAPAAIVRFDIPPPSGVLFTPETAFPTVSPDGRHVIYRVQAPNTPMRLWLYTLATQTARELPGTDGAGGTMWSPDSRAIAFVEGGRLKRLELAGGTVEAIAEFSGGAGGSWNSDGTIILGNPDGGLLRVSAAGGAVTPLTTPDRVQKEVGHILPQFLPDGRRFLFTVLPAHVVKLGSLDTPAQSELLKVGTHAFYASPGYLLYARQGTLLAQPFDGASGTVHGDAVPIAQGVRMYGNVYGLFSTSGNGVLLYERGESADGGTPVWVDRKGQTSPAVPEGLDNALFPRLSPDGRRLAVIRANDLWVQDLAGQPPMRLTFDGPRSAHFTPLWSPDGDRIVYEAQSPSKLQVVPSDGSTAASAPFGPEGHFHPYGWSSDRREVIATRLPGWDIVAVPAGGEEAPRDIVATPAQEGMEGVSISPDGRWIAYAADPTGQIEIWVRPFPGPGAPVRVSPSGGVDPVWGRNSRELFYQDPRREQLIMASLQAGPELRFTPPVALFGTSEFVASSQPPSYDVASDGRFLMIKRAGDAKPGTRPLAVVLNWAEELKRAAAGR